MSRGVYMGTAFGPIKMQYSTSRQQVSTVDFMQPATLIFAMPSPLAKQTALMSAWVL